MPRRRAALLVGVNRYTDPALRPLAYAAPDAAALDELLTRLGYETTLLHDGATRPELQPTRPNVLGELARLCAAADEDTLLLVYFACHGTREGKEALLVLRDGARARLEKTALPVAAVESTLRGCAASQKVLVLDACHAGIDIGRDLDRVTDADFLREVHERAQGFALLAASTAQQDAIEEAVAGHGLFTSFLLAGLGGEADRGARGFVTVSDLWDYVTANVRAYSAKNSVLLQEPTARVEGLGDIPLSDRPADPPRWGVKIGLPRDAYPPRRFSDWEPIGGLPRHKGQEAAPRHLTVVLSTGGRVHLFAVRFPKDGGPGVLWHRTDDGAGLSPWVVPAPAVKMTGGLAAAPAPDGALELVLYEEGRLRHRRLRGDVLEGEAADLGPAPAEGDAAPGLIARAPGWLDLFVRGEGGALWHRWRMPGEGWTDWHRHDGIFVLDEGPGVYSWETNKCAVYARAPGGSIVQRTCMAFHSYNWDTTWDLGGKDLRSPLPLSRGPNHVDIFARGPGGRLWQKTWIQTADWSDWVVHEGGPALCTGPAGVSRGPGAISLCGFGKDGELYGKRWRG